MASEPERFAQVPGAVQAEAGFRTVAFVTPSSFTETKEPYPKGPPETELKPPHGPAMPTGAANTKKTETPLAKAEGDRGTHRAC